MNVLVIMEDKTMATFYVLQLSSKGRELVRINPFLNYEQSTLIDIYQKNTFDQVMDAVRQVIAQPIEKYAILNQEHMIHLFFQEVPALEVSNRKACDVASENGEMIHFSKGKIMLTERMATLFIRYPKVPTVDKEAFTRQEHFLRLIKNYLLKNKNPIHLHKRFQMLLKQVTTNLSLKDVLTLLSIYSQSKEKMTRSTIG